MFTASLPASSDEGLAANADTEPGWDAVLRDLATEPDQLPPTPNRQVLTSPARALPTASARDLPTASARDLPTASARDLPTARRRSGFGGPADMLLLAAAILSTVVVAVGAFLLLRG